MMDNTNMSGIPLPTMRAREVAKERSRFGHAPVGRVTGSVSASKDMPRWRLKNVSSKTKKHVTEPSENSATSGGRKGDDER